MDIFEELEQKPKTGGPYRRFKFKSPDGSKSVRWSSLTQIWHGEPWSFTVWRLSLLKNLEKRTPAKPIKGRGQGCLHAGVAADVLPMNALLAFGFGSVDVLAGGVCLWSGDNPYWTAERVENLAASKPRISWQIVYNGPMFGKTYQRVSPRRWVLVEQNQGFA